MSEFTYAGKVEYTVDSTSVESLGFYYRLQSLNTDLNSKERAACARVAYICSTTSFQVHPSQRKAWEVRCQQDAIAEKDEYARRVYDEAFRLLRWAH